MPIGLTSCSQFGSKSFNSTISLWNRRFPLSVSPKRLSESVSPKRFAVRKNDFHFKSRLTDATVPAIRHESAESNCSQLPRVAARTQKNYKNRLPTSDNLNLRHFKSVKSLSRQFWCLAVVCTQQIGLSERGLGPFSVERSSNGEI